MHLPDQASAFFVGLKAPRPNFLQGLPSAVPWALLCGPPRPTPRPISFCEERNRGKKVTKGQPLEPEGFVPLTKQRQPVFVQHSIIIGRSHALHGNMAIV